MVNMPRHSRTLPLMKRNLFSRDRYSAHFFYQWRAQHIILGFSYPHVHTYLSVVNEKKMETCEREEERKSPVLPRNKSEATERCARDNFFFRNCSTLAGDKTHASLTFHAIEKQWDVEGNDGLIDTRLTKKHDS